MTSILTNSSAIVALQTLRSLNSSLSDTQNQVSSGLRVGSASDNAAYWSIATTMRSDNMAISAVSDALGLGAAKVDTAYAGTSAIVDILTEYKARLVAASEDGVDKAKIQTELNQFNDQAESVARSASFNGINWLATTEAGHLADMTGFNASVVSSFVRSNGGVTVKKIDVDLREISMINAGGGGILQKDGLVDIPDFGKVTYNTYRHEGHEDHTFYGPMNIGPSDTFSFTLVLDRSPVSVGEMFNIVIDRALVDSALGTSDGVVADAIDVQAVLQKAFDNAGAKASAYRLNAGTTTWYDVQSLDGYGYVASSIYFENMVTTLAGPEPYLGLDSPSANNHDNMETTADLEFGGPFMISAASPLTFDIQVGSGPLQTLTITKSMASSVLGNSDGRVASAEDFAALFDASLDGLGLVVNVAGSTLKLSVDQAIYPGYGNNGTNFYLSDIGGKAGGGVPFDLSEVDIVSDNLTIDQYISGVEKMLEKAIASGATLGSLQSRIQMQTEFAAKLSDSIDKGIGRLVDADMDEASTRLKALQTQEQLAIQSLSIANSSSENILSLFR